MNVIEIRECNISVSKMFWIGKCNLKVNVSVIRIRKCNIYNKFEMLYDVM